MDAKKQFNDRYVASLRAKDKPYTVRDGRGFSLHISTAGTKTFQYIFTLNGHKGYFKLGEYPALSVAGARKLFYEAYNQVKTGIDPRESRRKAKLARMQDTSFYTFDKLIDEGIPDLFVPKKVEQLAAVYYLKYSKQHHAVKVQTLVKYDIKRDVLPKIGSADLSGFKRRDAISFLETIIGRGANGSARNVAKVCRGMFDYAFEREWVEYQPFDKITRALKSLKITHDSRTLTDDEIKLVWGEIDKSPSFPAVKRALKLILVTAQRPGEVAQMHTSQIKGSWWTIPAAIAKNRREHRVYLSDLAMTLIDNGNESEYIFPSYKGNNHVSTNALSKCVCTGITTSDGKRSGSSRKGNRYFGLARWRPHDLRRTARTNMAKCKISNDVAEEVINHKKPRMTSVYNTYEYDDEKKEALVKWEKMLSDILDEKNNT